MSVDERRLPRNARARTLTGLKARAMRTMDSVARRTVFPTVTVGEYIDAYFERLGPTVTAAELVPLYAVLGWGDIDLDEPMITAHELADALEEDRP